MISPKKKVAKPLPIASPGLFHLPANASVNKKHPSIRKLVSHVPNSVSVLLPTFKNQSVTLDLTSHTPAICTFARPMSLNDLRTRGVNPAYNVNGNYLVFLVPRTDLNKFSIWFDSGCFDLCVEHYAHYTGKSFRVQPGDAIGGRINSLFKGVETHIDLLSSGPPNKGNAKEVSAFHITNKLLAGHGLYSTGDWKSLGDCLFFSYSDVNQITGHNQSDPQATLVNMVESSLIAKFGKYGNLVNIAGLK